MEVKSLFDISSLTQNEATYVDSFMLLSRSRRKTWSSSLERARRYCCVAKGMGAGSASPSGKLWVVLPNAVGVGGSYDVEIG